MSGVKGRSGRHKVLSTQIDEAMAIIDQELPAIVLQLVEKAKEGDRDALIYLIDRRMGKPKQATDLKLEGGEELTAGLVSQLFTILAAKRKELEQGTVMQIENTGLCNLNEDNNVTE
uniref:Uncharacterized protein n=1 Tax=viral metagenome TaxID=1070528 RepID=A0A6M3LVE6_9ZZZZ